MTRSLRCSLAILVVLSVGCAATRNPLKGSTDATCASSCKNVPAESQGECIAHCTK